MTVLAVSCEKGLDPIISVTPKADQSNPVVVIDYPVEGKTIISPDEVATVTLKLVATDDVELKSVTLQMDGTEIGFITKFMDYRRLDLKFDYTNMTDGDHTLTVTASDLTDKSVSKSVNFKKVTLQPYTPLDGEVLYWSFDGHYLDLITQNEAGIVGTPGFATGKISDAYAGATDAYLTYPADKITAGSEFSLSFWYKINAVPDRAGIFEISPPVPDPLNADRSKGLRLFRENNAGKQNIGLNLGIGATEFWINPFITVPNDEDWMHIAISISTTFATIYVNDAVVDTTSIDAKIDWTGCTSLSFASGEPNFIYWLHFSDLSLYDDMHVFTRAITADEVHTFFTAGK